MTSYTERTGDPEGNLGVPSDWVPVTMGGGDVVLSTAGAICRAIRCETGGTLNVKMPRTGTTRALKFKDGETRYGIFISTVDAGSTVTGVEAGI